MQTCDVLGHIWKTAGMEFGPQWCRVVWDEVRKIVKDQTNDQPVYVNEFRYSSIGKRRLIFLTVTNSKKCILHHNHNTYICGCTHTHTDMLTNIQPKVSQNYVCSHSHYIFFYFILFCSIILYQKKLLISIIWISFLVQ